MGHGSERGQVSGGSKPLVRRVLWVLGTGAAFLLLAVLGLGLGSLLTPGDSRRPEPEPLPAARPAARPAPEPPPLPPPPAPVREPPHPPPATTPEPPRPLLPATALTLPARLQLRGELIRDLGGFKDELARCPADPVRRPPGERAALVLETVVEGDAVRVVASRLEAQGPVNDRFVACARSVLEGKRLPATGATAGARLRLFLPLGPGGNTLSLPAASLTEAGEP